VFSPEYAFFCGKIRIRFKGKHQFLCTSATRNFESKIRASAEILNDWDFIAKVSGGDFVAKEVRYHKMCARRYQNKAQKHLITLRPSSSWHNIRQNREKAFKILSDFTYENIIVIDKAMTLKESFGIYCDALKELDPSISDFDFKSYPKKIPCLVVDVHFKLTD